MRCPSCSGALTPLKAGDVEVDACRNGCGGVWFDSGELDKFDEPHEFATHPILALAREKESVHVDAGKVKPCPHCPEEVLVRQFMDVKHQVEIDQCWKCGGIWLDPGELLTVRAQYKTSADRAQAVEAYVSEKVAESKQQMQSVLKTQLAAYEKETSNKFRAALFGLKKLLGLDDPFDGL